MTLDIHNWSSFVHQEIHKIVKDKIFPIINQVDARLQNFEIQFLKEAAKFVRDFKSLAKEAGESLAKHKALELEIERLLRAVVTFHIFRSMRHEVLRIHWDTLLGTVVSQDIMSIVQSNSVVDTSNLQTELERTKERFENCIIKKENEYAKLWNDWYKKCEECKYDKISYDKAYNDMQQKIEWLQAQLGDLKGKSKDTPCVSDTHDPLSQKLENENVELEFQALNYAKENAHLKTTYKNLFDSIYVTRTQAKTIIDSLQNKLHDTIYENAKLRSQLFDMVSEQKDITKGTSVNTKFANQSTKRKPSLQPLRNKFVVRQPNAFQSERPKLSNPGFFKRINPSKTFRKDKFVPINKVRASVRTNPITVSQSHVITKKDVNSDSNGFYSTGVDVTAKTRRPHRTCNQTVSKFYFFSWQFLGTARFGNDHIAAILDLKVAFRRNTCFLRNLEGVDLLKGNRTTNLYTINLHDMASASLIYLMARATSTKSWLWHQRLSYLNFDTINDLSRNDLVTGLPKFKYHKEHLCPSCEQGKGKRASHPPKPVLNSKQRLHLLHLDLCGPIRIASINGKWYVLVIMDDYSRYTWVHFLRSKDEAPKVIKTFLKKITVLLQDHVIMLRTDNGAEFKNQVLQEYFNRVGISHQASFV
ncbi:retrovirus-related pol polyprotein from transposon TNT 1-94 [Tanacetum coccineum]|uniref:Retrovirus-related pol polyprotein from transposon TNT 1-94 n=1 Tax=Tanacetum coccineum TaxID=301880 RepID=A0ABQ5CYR4_9ASTR